MIGKEEYNSTLIKEFKNFLDNMQYHLILTIVLGEELYHTNPLPDYKRVKTELTKLSATKRAIFSFFLLGEPIEKGILEDKLKSEILQYLIEINIINHDQTHYWMNNYILTSYCNCYFLVSNAPHYPTCQSVEQKPYIGTDTYWLSRIIVNNTYGDVLDLCSGSGVQAILSAKNANRVVAVELDEKSAQIAKFNTYINNVNEKVDVRIGNLYQVVDENERFDFIVSNPPFIPIPKEIKFHMCGDGGEDGTLILNQIFYKCKSHLKPNGQVIIIGQCIGTKEKALIENVIAKFFHNTKISLVLNSKTTLQAQATGFADLASKYNQREISPDEWLKMYAKMGMEYYYTFTLFIQNSEGVVEKTQIYDALDLDDIIKSNVVGITEYSTLFSVKTFSGANVVVDQETIEFLKRIDGISTIETIIDKMPFKFKIKYGNDGDVKQKIKFISLCASLERSNVVKKTNLEKNNLN